MSMSPQSSLPFTLSLGALGKGSSCPKHLRTPGHVSYPFTANVYTLESTVSQTPFVGSVDLEQDGSIGYEVAPVGQLQILIKGEHKAVKVFLLQYDLRDVPLDGRLLARERTYVVLPPPTSSSPGSLFASSAPREALRYAIQLQFACSGSDAPECRYYVSKSIKIIFTPSLPDPSETLRTERTDEIIHPTPAFLPWERDPDGPIPPAPARVQTPTKEMFVLPSVAGKAVPTNPRAATPTPNSPRFGRRRLGSLEERELSERLRAMKVGAE